MQRKTITKKNPATAAALCACAAVMIAAYCSNPDINNPQYAFHTLTVNAGTGGSVSSAPAAGKLRNGTFITVRATPANGYTFGSWTAGSGRLPSGVTAANPEAAFSISGDVSITAGFKLIQYTVTYVLNGGTVSTANPTSYNIATAAFTLNNPTRTGYIFTGWTEAGETTPQINMTVRQGNIGDRRYTANWAFNLAELCIVTFLDHDGTVLKRDTLTHGSAATAPSAPTRIGYTFAGWDKTFGNVTGDLSVTARYEVIKYTVTFLDHFGTVLKRDTVSHGSAANAPGDPARIGYTFTGWDKTFDNVTGTLSVTARYEIIKYTVTFLDYDGSVLKRDTVNHGSAATAPSDPAHIGYTFTGWDKSFNNVTGNLTVTALFKIYTFNPDIGYEEFTDERDGQIYKYVTIGTQTWMAENLNYSGSDGNLGVCYNNRADSCAQYGRLYTWSTVMNGALLLSSSSWGSQGSQVQTPHQGICPTGWHVPSDAEWDVLMTVVGGSSTAGRKLKSKSGWYNNGNGTDEYGFSALPGGNGGSGGGLYAAGDYGGWWSATEYNTSYAYIRVMFYGNENVNRYYYGKSNLFSARCLWN